MEQEDVIEWEKEQMTGKNENLFRFFFNHGGDSPKKKPFEDWFSKFSKNRDEDLQDDNLGSNRRSSGQQRSSSLRREDEKQESSDERHFQRSQQAHSEDMRNRAQYQSKSRSHADKSETGRQNKRNEDIVDDETVTQPRKENKNPTRSKKSSKKQFKKKSNPKDAKDFARQYTQGTDGKWYHKTKDGRWEVVDGSPPKMDQKNKSKPKKNEPKDSGSKPESYTDENGNVIVKGDDGNWYMRVKPPPAVSKKADSSHEKPKMQENKKKDEKVNRESPNFRLPQGLFRNDRGQIHDRMGNIYERQSNGRYLMIMSAADAKAKLKEQLRSNKQEDIMRQARDKPASRTNQPLYKDNNGNVFVKDSLGNLIKVRVGGGRGKQSEHAEHRDGATSSGRRWKDEEDIEDEEERMLRQHWQRKRRSPAHEEL